MGGAATGAYFGGQFPRTVIPAILTAPFIGINQIVTILAALWGNDVAMKDYLLHKAQQCEGLKGEDGYLECKINLLNSIKKILINNKNKCKNSNNSEKCMNTINKYIEQIKIELEKISTMESKLNLKEDMFPFVNKRNAKSLFLNQLPRAIAGTAIGGLGGAAAGALLGKTAQIAHDKSFRKRPITDDLPIIGMIAGGSLGSIVGGIIGNIKGVDSGAKKYFLQSAIQCDELSGNAKVNCKIELLKGMKTELVKSSKKCKDEKCIRKFNFYISRIENELRNLK